DFELLKYLVENGGFRYYAPEVDASQAYFLNKYLENGNEELLDFVMFFYQKRVPQDASHQLKAKWQMIYQFNKGLDEDDQIIVVGTDRPSGDKRLSITHLAHLLGESKTGIPQVDSLQMYRNTTLEIRKVWSGKPAQEKIAKYGGYTAEYYYPVQSKYNFTWRFMRYYEANKENVLEAFNAQGIDAEPILESPFKNREEHIFNGFKDTVIPLIESGEKVYSNFGFSHIMQKEIFNSCYLACLVKNEFPELRMETVLGLLSNSEVLKYRKWKKSKETIEERGLVFQKMVYKGYSTSSTWDGDYIFEKLDGINELKKAAKSHDVLFLDLDKPNSPMKDSRYFSNYKRGVKNMFPGEEGSTLDFFQFIIYMKGSEANVPLESAL
ncbi:MAG: hypothetical protein AAGC47_12920, partial [Bacteroidota bacterium]